VQANRPDVVAFIFSRYTPGGPQGRPGVSVSGRLHSGGALEPGARRVAADAHGEKAWVGGGSWRFRVYEEHHGPAPTPRRRGDAVDFRGVMVCSDSRSSLVRPPTASFFSRPAESVRFRPSWPDPGARPSTWPRSSRRSAAQRRLATVPVFGVRGDPPTADQGGGRVQSDSGDMPTSALVTWWLVAAHRGQRSVFGF